MAKKKFKDKTELEQEEEVLKAPQNKGVDVNTGELKPVIDITKSPFGQAMQQKSGISPEQQNLLDINRLRQAQERAIAGVNLPDLQKRQAEIESAAPKKTDFISSKLEPVIDKVTDIPSVSSFVESRAKILTTASAFLPDFLNLGTKKSVEVQKAEQAFSDMSTVLDEDAKLVAAGLKDLSSAQKNIDTALEAIIRLEEQTHGTGRLNLRYWIDTGAELEAQILKEKQTLQNKRLALIAAGQQAILTGGIK